MSLYFTYGGRPDRRPCGGRKKNGGPGKRNSNRRGMGRWCGWDRASGDSGCFEPQVFAEVPMTAKTSLRTVAVIDTNKCAGCALCEVACKRQAAHMNEDGAAVIDTDKCTGCGLCVNECPAEAISLLTGV